MNTERAAKIAEYTSGVHNQPVAAVYAAMVGRPEWAPIFWRIPDRMHESIILWVLFGCRPGSFMSAVIRHDLMGAARAADDENQKLLYEYAFVLNNAMPATAHGPDALPTWKGMWPEEDGEDGQDP